MKNNNEPVNVTEFQELARLALPKMHYDYYAGGAEDEHTLEQNVKAFSRITIHPRVLMDVSRIDMSTTILGYTTSAPIIVAPSGQHKLAHVEGEVATARASAASNVIMVLSFSSSCPMEDVVSCCNAVRFFQLYVYKRRELSAMMVQRAERNGFKAIVVTVDVPRLGRREADIRHKMNARGITSSAGVVEMQTDINLAMQQLSDNFDPSFCWEDIEWLKSVTNLPILIKGILSGEDALRAVEAGASGIIVSNHGGRQLDYTPATISVVEEVAVAVRGRIPIVMDGGVRRGSDIFKALALGAQAVMIGRAVIFGLAAKGEDGVKQVIGMLKHELEVTMALSGCSTLKDISRSHVRTHAQHHHCLRGRL